MTGEQTRELRDRYRHEDGRPCIDIHLASWRQFFDSRDPSPFRDRDLDEDAVEYIVNSFLELGRPHEAKIVLHLVEEEGVSLAATAFRDSINEYFAYRTRLVRTRLRQTLARGRAALVIGVLFLGVCLMVLQQTAGDGTGLMPSFIREGMIILGWVAMWRPADALIYSWLPLRDEMKTYQRLQRLPVEVRYGSQISPVSRSGRQP